MKSKWESVKPKAIELRKQGNSIKSIELKLGVPSSTLSGWFKNIPLSEEQKKILKIYEKERLNKARVGAVKWHNAGKAERLAQAVEQANQVLVKIPTSNESLELALAFLYLGEGAKNNNTSLGSSNPKILRFYITCIQRLYGVKIEKIKCYLHLRADQDDTELKEYWSGELNIPIENFGKTSFDKRTAGRATYADYKGVCLVECGRVEIQRRLMYIANGYCDIIANAKS